MSEVVSRVTPRVGSTTADDLARQEAHDAGVVSGGHLLAAALKVQRGLTRFQLSGARTIESDDGRVNECMRILDVRHQQVAAHPADGYARHTGESRWAVMPAGDCTNTVTGIAKAFPSERPMLHLGGHCEGAREPALRSALAQRSIAPAVSRW
ncbi:thiamine pyrophosphate-binding protein [Paraburkholderia sp. DGU8]|uniref:thiamine pyrophosphate-binding protein n=1 Tax=Paraburkholderia sp. DGU8 TaxID=3161997 RepID=UPI00346630C7